MTDSAVIELARLRKEVAALVMQLAPWIGMEEMCSRYSVSSKTVLAMERRGDIPMRARGRWRRSEVLEYERL